VGSCDVLGVWVGLHVGGGAMLRALAWITLGDGPGLGTLGSGVVGNRGHSNLSDGVPVASRFIAPGRSIGRGISHSF
jgi:hypothetical protein